MLSSSSMTGIKGSIFYIGVILPAIIVIVLSLIKSFKPSKFSKLSPASSLELALPIVGILGMFLAKIGINSALSKLPHYLTGDYNHQTPDLQLSAKTEFGFIFIIALYFLIFVCIAFEHIKKDPAIIGNFKKPRTLVLASLLISLSVVGDAISIPVGEHLFISFSFIFLSAIAFLFGPIVAFASGMIVDVIGFMINSGGYAFDLRYTIIGGFTGILYSIFLYKRDAFSKFFIVNIFFAKASVNLIINVILNYILMRGYFGNAASMFAVLRIFKNIGMLPVEMLIMLFVLKAVSRAAVSYRFIEPLSPSVKKLKKSENK